jgi:hypothetical protein
MSELSPVDRRAAVDASIADLQLVAVLKKDLVGHDIAVLAVSGG